MVAEEIPISTSVEHRDGVTVVAVGGEIDMLTAPTLERVIAEVLAEDPAALVIDLLKVDFLGSAGLSVLVATREKVSKHAGFAVVAQGSVTARIIQRLDLDEFLSLHETLEDALTAVKAQKPGSGPTLGGVIT